MKTNIIPALGKSFGRTLPFCILTLFAACDRNDVEDVSFRVSVQQPEEVYAGENVTFQFEGNPDYISFYAGDRNNKYEYSDRTKMELDSLGFSHSAIMRYGETYDYLGDRILRVLVSEDYSGVRTPEAVRAATWTELTDTDREGALETPVLEKGVSGGTAKEVPYSAINLTEYKDKEFFLAYQYIAEPHTGSKTNGDKYTEDGKEVAYKYDNRPRVDVNSMQLVKREPDGNLITLDNPLSGFGFTNVFVSTKMEKPAAFNIDKKSLMFQPKEYENEVPQDENLEVWMISQKIIPNSVELDRGTPIKGTNARLSTYQYSYKEAGTYTATFIVTNANKWDSKQTVHQITVNVKPAR